MVRKIIYITLLTGLSGCAQTPSSSFDNCVAHNGYGGCRFEGVSQEDGFGLGENFDDRDRINRDIIDINKQMRYQRFSK